MSGRAKPPLARTLDPAHAAALAVLGRITAWADLRRLPTRQTPLCRPSVRQRW
jgi:hypothetical protein